MRGKETLYIDQYGQPVWARTVKELREKCGGGRVTYLRFEQSWRRGAVDGGRE